MMVRGLQAATILRSAIAVIEASIRIRLQRFDHVAQWAVRRPVRPKRSGSIAADRRAVLAWCRRVPWRALCMEQGVALAWLTARRGEAVTIFYGAGTHDHNLNAHVWVMSGEIPVIGCEIADRFVILSQISNASSSSSIHGPLYKRPSEES